MSGGAASAPSGSCGATVEGPPPASTEGTDGSSMQGGGDWPEPSSPDAAAPQEPGANGGSSVTGDWLPAIGLPYVVLDNGTVAVLHNEETNTWEVYDSVPPWEK